MRKYRYWTLDELKAAVIHLEQAQATGAASTSYSAAGSVAYVLRPFFEATIRELYDAIDAREGRGTATVYRVVSDVGRRGYR